MEFTCFSVNVRSVKVTRFTSSRTEISSIAVALNWRDNIMKSGSCSTCSISRLEKRKQLSIFKDNELNLISDKIIREMPENSFILFIVMLKCGKDVKLKTRKIEQ